MDGFIDAFLKKLTEALNAMPVETFVEVITAMAVTLTVVQLIKAGAKMYKRASTEQERDRRKLLNFLISFLVGIIAGIYMIDPPSQWPFLIGLFNSVIYLFLVRLAYAKNWLVLLSLLKSRKLQRGKDGSLSLVETQRFMVD